LQNLTRLIATAVSRSQPGITQEAARALAETIVGDLQAANFRIIAPGAAPPAKPQAQRLERRRSSRAAVIKSATLVFNQGNCTMDCHVLDLSKTGARLKPSDILTCPNEFTLKFQQGAAHHCEVKWRRGSMVGVRFL
jgi:hypothetical protein